MPSLPRSSSFHRWLAAGLSSFAFTVAAYVASGTASAAAAATPTEQPASVPPSVPSRPAEPDPAPPKAMPPTDPDKQPEGEDLPLRPPGTSEVVVFCDVSREFAEPVIAAFQARTKLKVRPIYPAPSDEPADAADRLAGEHRAGRHTIDVWWSDELCRTLALAEAGAFEPYQSESADRHAGEAGWPKALRAEDWSWYGVGRTLKVVAYHTLLVDPKDLPADLSGFTDKAWSARVGIADPARGGSRTLLAALQTIDEGRWLDGWLAGLKANQVRIYPTESDLMTALAEGKVAVAITDSAAALAGARARQPVRIRVLAGRTLVSAMDPQQANVRFDVGPAQGLYTVAVLKSGPNRDHAALFVDYLLCNEAAEILASAPGELIRVEPHFSSGFARWCDGYARSGRPAPMHVPLEGLVAGQVAERDRAALAKWRTRLPPTSPSTGR